MAMNPMGGIDQQITQRAARMKNDPNALMQQYGQSKNILDLIAAQRAAEKVQKEKQLAALQMQGNPPTVADQLEQTIVAAEKEKMAPDLAGMKNLRDRTKGVAGVLAQKQRQQQKRMQQMGQQPPRPPQQQPQQQRPQGQPTMAATGGLMTQRAPNLERMYNGGIVGYNVGGGVYEPTEEEIDAAFREQRVSSNATRESVKNMLIREQELAEQRAAVGSFFSGIGERASRQRDARQEAIGEAPARGIRSTRPEEVIETESVTEVMPTGGVDLAAQRRAQDLTDAVNTEQREMAAAAAREPDIAAAAVEEVEAPLSVQEQMDAALAQREPVRPEGMMFDPEVMQAGRQQAADEAAKEQFGRNAASLGLGGMSIKPLEKMTQAPELLRRRPNTPLTLEQEYEALQRKQLADLKKDETGLTDTRSNTRRLLDRLTDAAINASKRPAAASNRGALASFGLGISEAVRAEEKERKEGLAGIRERRNALLKAREDRELAKAQISQGQQRVDTLGKQLEQDQAQFEQRIEAQSDQFKQTMRLKTDELASTSALNIIKAQSKSDYDTAMLGMREAELDAQTAFNDAKTNQGNQELRLRAAKVVGDYTAKLEEVQREAIDALSFNPQFKGNPEALKKAEDVIRLEFTKLKNAKKDELAALNTGSISYSSIAS
jgi:hypothetical protein